ncbi:histidine kinase-like ATPase [Zychaea mexicana]|uniref:histidine kinase-like ATPase n=1 Tax=Zychaea mexicana TaxID=64656 RepID=UPI0022FE9E3E|nr:histidine kinase-like ATPase [Zychaea mexicana]KAI9497884.1 histidine kinase-like ATPase [Zychaea mexicana]
MAYIAALPPQVIRQLRASVNITNVQQCVEELVTNALDADASQIDVAFDAEKFTVRVDDDGTGIEASELTQLAKRHAYLESLSAFSSAATSKCKTLDDLGHVRTFGYRGQALASLADIAIVQIISRHRRCDEAQMGIWKDGRLVETSPTQPRQPGTTVVVRDLFYKFPVRRRFLSSGDRTSESIKRWILTMALAFPHVGFTLRERDTKLLATKKHSSDLNVLHRLYGHEFAQNMRSFEYNDDTDIKLQGLFGIAPCPSKNQQFIYINQHPIDLGHDLYRTTEQSKKGKGVVEKHPAFVIHVEDPNISSHDISLYLLDEHKIHPRLHGLVRQLAANFLRAHNFITSAAYKQLVHINEVDDSTSRKSRKTSSSHVVASSSWLYNNEVRRSRLRKTHPSMGLSPSNTARTITSTTPSSLETTTAAAQHEGPAIRLNKEQLKGAKVLGQVDNKFILIKLNAGQLLLVDQHAADERVQLERMLWSLKDTAEATQLDPSIAIDLSSTECALAQKYATQLGRWGFRLSTSSSATALTAVPAPSEEEGDAETTKILRYSKHFSTRAASPHFEKKKKGQVLVTRLPRLIADRCMVNRDMLRDLIREHLHSLDRVKQFQEADNDNDQEVKSFTYLHGCPRGMMRILRSKACRGAIMFNDSLTLEQCRWLIQALSSCRFPFQCVHGRPSMIPLVTIDGNRPRRHRINWDRFYT